MVPEAQRHHEHQDRFGRQPVGHGKQRRYQHQGQAAGQPVRERLAKPQHDERLWADRASARGCHLRNRARNRLLRDSSMASNAATQRTPGPLNTSWSMLGPTASGNSVQTMAKKNNGLSMSPGRFQASSRSRLAVPSKPLGSPRVDGCLILHDNVTRTIGASIATSWWRRHGAHPAGRKVLANDGFDELAPVAIQVGKRFVHEPQVSARQQHPRECHAALLAGRQRAQRQFAQLIEGQALENRIEFHDGMRPQREFVIEVLDQVEIGLEANAMPEPDERLEITPAVPSGSVARATGLRRFRAPACRAAPATSSSCRCRFALRAAAVRRR